MGNVQDVEVGPIWDQGHAEVVAAEYIQDHPEFEWTGHWNTTRPGEMSTIQIRRREQIDDDNAGSSPPHTTHRSLHSLGDSDQRYQPFLPGIDSALHALQHGLTSFFDDRLNNEVSAGQSSSNRRGGHIGQNNVASDWEVLNTVDSSDSDDADDHYTTATRAPNFHSRTYLGDSIRREEAQAVPTVDAPTCSEVMDLVAMFPNISDTIICELLENNNYDTEKTVEQLLQLDPNETQKKSPLPPTPSDNSLPIPTCPVCYEPLKPPKRIFQCTNGHLVCDICKRQPQLRGCPTCRQPIMGRATAMEQLIADLQKATL